MRRPIIVFFLALFWVVVAQAHERGALFKVTAHGHTMHLFGTMHVGLSQFFPLEPKITAAVAGASTLALELDPDQPALSLMRSMGRYGMLTPDDACYERLAPAQRQRLERLERQAGLDPASAKRFKPVLLATMLSLSEYEKLGYRPDLGTDKYLARLARSGKARILELESFDTQLQLLDTLPRPEQLRFLEETLASIESGAQQAEIRLVVDAWGSADQDALQRMSDDVERDTSLSGQFTREILLDGRNRALADKLAQLLAKEENTVAAIGVLHVLGKRGVPALLRARGLTVERVY
jgi:uncharacterized protein